MKLTNAKLRDRPVTRSRAMYTRVTEPYCEKSSLRSFSCVSSERFDTRRVGSLSRDDRMLSRSARFAPDASRIIRGTYAPVALGPTSPVWPDVALTSPTGFILPDAILSLFGHLRVQWSPVIPQMRHTTTLPIFSSTISVFFLAAFALGVMS